LIFGTVLIRLAHVRLEPNFFLCDSLIVVAILELAWALLELIILYALLRWSKPFFDFF